jgi:hypothetical protein
MRPRSQFSDVSELDCGDVMSIFSIFAQRDCSLVSAARKASLRIFFRAPVSDGRNRFPQLFFFLLILIST